MAQTRSSPPAARLLEQLSSSSASAFRSLGPFFISTSPFHSLGAAFTTISGHFKAGFRTVRLYLSRSSRLQLIHHFNEIFASAIFILQTFLQLKYLAISEHSQSLFAIHPTAMPVAVACSVVYFLAYGAVLGFPVHRLALLAHHVLLCSGCIAVASLAAVTLADTVTTPFVYAVFGLLAAAGLLYFWYRKLVAEEAEAQLRIRRFSRENFSELMRRLPV